MLNIPKHDQVLIVKTKDVRSTLLKQYAKQYINKVQEITQQTLTKSSTLPENIRKAAQKISSRIAGNIAKKDIGNIKNTPKSEKNKGRER